MRKRLSILAWPRVRGVQHRAVCHFCDTLHDAPTLPEGTAARCSRCGAVLYQNRPASLARATAFSLTALVLMAVVHTFPFMLMESNGITTRLNPMAAARALIEQGSPIVGCGVALFTVITPFFMAGGLLYVCGPLMIGRAAPGAMWITRWMHRTEPWNMIEVFLLGVLVSMLKIAKMAEVHFGIGFWAFAALMFCMAAAIAGIDRNELWDRLEVARS